jgi:WD40 repeat protein
MIHPMFLKIHLSMLLLDLNNIYLHFSTLYRDVKCLTEYAPPHRSSTVVKPSVIFELASNMNEPALLQKIPESGPSKQLMLGETDGTRTTANPSVAQIQEASSALMPIDIMKQSDVFGQVGQYVRRGKLIHELPKPEKHAKWKLLRVISGHTGWVRSLSVDISNEWFASGAGDRTIKVPLYSSSFFLS